MVSIKDLKKHKGVDIEKYNGVKSTIQSVEILEPKTYKFNGVDTEVINLCITSKNLADEGEKEFTANELVRLYEDEGVLGFSTKAGSKAQKILTYYKVDDFEELVGKECLIVKRVTEKGQFLGIQYG